jgi:hypothetical protein
LAEARDSIAATAGINHGEASAVVSWAWGYICITEGHISLLPPIDITFHKYGCILVLNTSVFVKGNMGQREYKFLHICGFSSWIVS